MLALREAVIRDRFPRSSSGLGWKVAVVTFFTIAVCPTCCWANQIAFLKSPKFVQLLQPAGIFKLQQGTAKADIVHKPFSPVIQSAPLSSSIKQTIQIRTKNLELENVEKKTKSIPLKIVDSNLKRQTSQAVIRSKSMSRAAKHAVRSDLSHARSNRPLVHSKLEVIDGSLSVAGGNDMSGGILSQVQGDPMADGVLSRVPSDGVSITPTSNNLIPQRGPLEVVEGSLAVAGGGRSAEMIGGALAAIKSSKHTDDGLETPIQQQEDQEGSLAATHDDGADVSGPLSHVAASVSSAGGVLSALPANSEAAGGVLTAVKAAHTSRRASSTARSQHGLQGLLYQLREWQHEVRELGKVAVHRLQSVRARQAKAEDEAARSRAAVDGGSAPHTEPSAAPSDALLRASGARHRAASLVRKSAPSDDRHKLAAEADVAAADSAGAGRAGVSDIGWTKTDWGAAAWAGFMMLGPVATAAVTVLVGWYAGTVAAVCTCAIMVSMDLAGYYYSWFSSM